MKQKLVELVKEYKDDIVKTASEMIQINSQSTQEGEIVLITSLIFLEPFLLNFM